MGSKRRIALAGIALSALFGGCSNDFDALFSAERDAGAGKGGKGGGGGIAAGGSGATGGGAGIDASAGMGGGGVAGTSGSGASGGTAPSGGGSGGTVPTGGGGTVPTGGAGGTSPSGGGAGGSSGVDSGLKKYVDEVKADVPISYWRLNEAPGATIAKDEMAKHDGNYITKVSGKPVYLGLSGAIADGNKAAGFDGQHGIQVPNTSDLEFLNFAPFTIEFWAMRKDLDGSSTPAENGQFRFMVKYDSTNNHGYTGYFQTASGDLNFFRIDGPTSPADRDWVHAAYSSSTFHYVVIVHDPVLKQLQMWIDDIKVNVDTADEAMAVASGKDLIIGNAPNYLSWFEGVLDEFAIYGKALSSTRIQAHFAAAKVP